MRWDETRFGLIYDLDIYMIVAVDDFNMGAMENKGLNVFNSKFVLAKPDTATDVDYEGIEAVIAHEYFHNWTGNRVTCRDWFQLTLKEGLTVFRDQEFTADMLSPEVKRIEDVKRLRSNQFPEDAGPMAHPIQPQSYIEMNNFYTMTVYEKGAEVVRMYHTLLGEEGFRRGMDLYFKRHDGQAVTVDDFRRAMQDANNIILEQMHHWYVQAGTPTLKINTHFDATTNLYRIEVAQSLASVENKADFKPLLIPLKMGLLNSAGLVIALKPAANTLHKVMGNAQECVLRITEVCEFFEFEAVDELPVLALLKGFSAPVQLEYAYSDAELSLLSRADSDAFVRWEAMQTLFINELKANVKRFESGDELALSDAMQSAFKGVLEDTTADAGWVALAMTLPDLTYIGEQYPQVPVEAVYETHLWLRTALAKAFSDRLLTLYQTLNQVNAPYRYDKNDIAKRKLKNSCLRYLMRLPEHLNLAKAQYFNSQNMTDVLAALETLSHTESHDRAECLAHFYAKWQHDGLVLDKWFTLQAASHHLHALEQVKALIEHPDFIYTNPNRVRSVIGVFGRLSWLGFHRQDGLGYEFLAQQVLKIDALNPQVAARMVAPFTHWQRFDDTRKAQMRAALEKILAHTPLSKDVFEIVSKSLH
ncbi:aminopeptidase N [Thiomicrorhabdus aquaedulcis]|uniref:aminopeptidase N n=1 Tax=Thiomicrorhabdus aquaedulcis TaxID=2211106 RepID=UPI0030B8397C